MPAECGVCRFRDAVSPTPTCAFVLAFDGRPLPEVLAAVLERARRQAVPGCSTYCRSCRQLTWLAHETTLLQALTRHERDYAVGVQIQQIFDAGF